MIKKYVIGTPIETNAIVADIPSESVNCGSVKLADLTIELSKTLKIEYTMADSDVVFGLGEANRGINKRGFTYVSSCNDDPCHTEDKVSFYGAHNFIVISGSKHTGLFIDCASKVFFDIGYTEYDKLCITCPEACTLYVLEGDSAAHVTKMFREIIGRSYIPPYWAFGYQQSRWSYDSADDVRSVVKNYRDNDISLDAVYLDIDYMDSYKDFTINDKKFPDFENFVNEMKQDGIHLVPIIDAGVKIEEGYDVYEEGIKEEYFCKDNEGGTFAVGVWPGLTHLPDFFQEKTRRWFGDKYSILLDKGIDGFWNDMNEPAMFYTEKNLKKAIDYAKSCEGSNMDLGDFFKLKDSFMWLSNRDDDYASIRHNINGELVEHPKVHNLYGTNMTLAAAECFDRHCPDSRVLLFSRSSYIGMHRYSGIWTGDNMSWWSHLLLNIKMMPSLNMCGFLYSGADLGGFGCHVTSDLLLRWLAFGIFTPLMRNHSAAGTRIQEAYRFGNIKDFKNIIDLRYMLIPHLYSEFVKAAYNNDMLFKPLAFDYPEDLIAVHTEDQLLLGDSIMLAPVYTQNSIGRTVYLPEEMLYLKYGANRQITCKILPKGHYYLDVALNEVPIFIRPNKLVPLALPAKNTAELSSSYFKVYGYINKPCEVEYTLYEDDGYTKDITLDKMYQIKVIRTKDEKMEYIFGSSKNLDFRIF